MKESTERSGDGAAGGGVRSTELSEPISPLSKGSQSVRVRSRAPFSSRCRLAAMAAGLHPAIRGCESLHLDHFHSPVVQPVERRAVNADVAGAEPAWGAIFVGETASDVTCPTCRHCSEHHRGRRPISPAWCNRSTAAFEAVGRWGRTSRRDQFRVASFNSEAAGS
jgi:hypothetical protein